MMPQSQGNTAPITTKVQAVANKVAPTANKMGNESFVYAGYKPLPAELEQQSMKTNPMYSNATANTTAYASNQKPVVYSAYSNPPYYYGDGNGNQGYGNPMYPAQGNWGYQSLSNNAPGGWNNTPIMAQSAMYPPVAPQPGYYQPWQADCGCGGNQAYTMNQSAGKFGTMNQSAGNFAAMNESGNKFAPMNQSAATKVSPTAAKGKRSGKKVNITATASKKKPKQSKGNKPWLNV